MSKLSELVADLESDLDILQGRVDLQVDWLREEKRKARLVGGPNETSRVEYVQKQLDILLGRRSPERAEPIPGSYAASTAGPYGPTTGA